MVITALIKLATPSSWHSQSYTYCLDLDNNLAKVLLVPLVLVRLLHLLEPKDLLVNDRLDLVRVNRLVHLVKLLLRADEQAADGADVGQRIEQRRLVLGRVAVREESDDGDDALELDGLERLRDGARPADLDDVVRARAAGRQALGDLAPVRRLLVVDDVVRAELLELLALGGGGRRRDDGRAGGDGKLDRGQADAAGALGEDDVAGLEGLGLDAVEGVPGGQGRAGEGAGLDGVEGGRGLDEAVFREDGVLAEGAVEGAAEAAADGERGDGVGLVVLVEEGADVVALGELGDLGADGEDAAGAVGGGDAGEADGEGVEALRARVMLVCVLKRRFMTRWD